MAISLTFTSIHVYNGVPPPPPSPQQCPKKNPGSYAGSRIFEFISTYFYKWIVVKVKISRSQVNELQLKIKLFMNNLNKEYLVIFFSKKSINWEVDILCGHWDKGSKGNSFWLILDENSRNGELYFWQCLVIMWEGGGIPDSPSTAHQSNWSSLFSCLFSIYFMAYKKREHFRNGQVIEVDCLFVYMY